MQVHIKSIGRPAKRAKIETEADTLTRFFKKRVESYVASEKEFSVKSLFEEAIRKGFDAVYMKDNKKLLKSFIRGTFKNCQSLVCNICM